MSRGHVIALCGGVGGAKFAFGLTRVLAPADLTIIVNTGDDFEHLGLAISPDLDTVAYTLSDLADRDRGWGRKDETWNFMTALCELGGEEWFKLGDRDLAIHVERSRRLAGGERLSDITAHIATALGITHAIIPMSDDPVRTIVTTDLGKLDFQTYFVREQCRPVVLGLQYQGAAEARPSAGFARALAREDVAAVLLCPSNPYLSIDPILSLPGVRAQLKALDVPFVAISPIIGGTALKGPAAKMMRELGAVPGVKALATHYDSLLTGLVIDGQDREEAEALGASGSLSVLVTDTIMGDDPARIRLARETLEFARAVSK